MKQSNPRKALDEEQKRRDLEELMEIDKFMRENQGNGNKKISVGELQEEIIPTQQSNQFKGKLLINAWYVGPRSKSLLKARMFL